MCVQNVSFSLTPRTLHGGAIIMMQRRPDARAFAAVRPFPEIGTHAQEKKKIMSLDWHSDLLASRGGLVAVAYGIHTYVHVYYIYVIYYTG